MPHPVPRPQQFAVKVKKGVSGLGLFADEPIPPGRFIIEYYGTLITDDEANEIGGRYLFDLENGKAIDGSPRTNIARYANHACRPNSEVRVVGNRVFIFSTKRIPAGEEITYDYGKEYTDEYIKPYGCRCKTCEKKRAKQHTS